MSMSFLCTTCNCNFPLAYDTDKAIGNLWKHLIGNPHNENDYYDSLQCLICNKTIYITGNPRTDGCRAEEHINSYSHRMKVRSHYDDNYTNKNDSYDSTESDQEDTCWSFYCCVCSCDIQVSSDVEKSSRQLKCHIKGQQHKDNIKQPGIDKSMICKSCDRPITVSVNVNSSIRNLNEHINSC